MKAPKFKEEPSGPTSSTMDTPTQNYLYLQVPLPASAILHRVTAATAAEYAITRVTESSSPRDTSDISEGQDGAMTPQARTSASTSTYYV